MSEIPILWYFTILNTVRTKKKSVAWSQAIDFLSVI
jgi:hypothetical protein